MTPPVPRFGGAVRCRAGLQPEEPPRSGSGAPDLDTGEIIPSSIDGLSRMQSSQPGWTLSVLIPVFNERNTIEEILRRVCRIDLPKQVVIVDDGSTDGTREFLQELQSKEGLRSSLESLSAVNSIEIHFQPYNQGKAAAVRRAIELARGDIVIFQDADLEYDPRDYHRLVEPILDGRADVVFGSRFTGSPRRVLLFWHALGNHILTTLSNAFTNLNLTDMETCYKAFRSEVLRLIRIESDRFNIEPEITAKVAKLHCRIYEVPISYSGRDYAEGKKIGWRDGVTAVMTILRFALRDPLAQDNKEYLALRQMRSAGRYGAWIHSRIAPYIGRRIMEAGAGTGSISRRLIDADEVHLLESNPLCLYLLQNQFASHPHMHVHAYDPAAGLPAAVRPGSLDTIVSLNILEQLEDDAEALRQFYQGLDAGGRLVVLVPAGRWLEGPMDQSFGHRRRYQKEELSQKLRTAGFQVEELSYFNLLGSLGWFVNSCLLRRRTLPGIQLRLFDRLVPLLRLEDKWRPPFGVSLLAVARKPR